jgi:AraC-like DNA-binding protein
MERLQVADHDDTVTKIARECGYRFMSNFTTDFQREFGVTPSVVLRTSRMGAK